MFWSCKSITILQWQIDDARAAMMLYQKNRKEWEKTVKDQTRMWLKQKKRKPKKKAKYGNNASTNDNPIV
jgi:RNA exonuclease 4